MSDLGAFEDLARSRRTHMLVHLDRAVDPALIERLCTVATWAPNHKRTWPWRFAAFTGEGRARLGEAYVADMIDADFGDEGKHAKTLTKYLRAPTILVVGCIPDRKPTVHLENRDAVAAAIQTLLLGATAAGLASFWSTAPLTVSPRVNELSGFEPDTRVVAVIYLGWPQATVEAPPRPVTEVHRVDS